MAALLIQPTHWANYRFPLALSRRWNINMKSIIATLVCAAVLFSACGGRPGGNRTGRDNGNAANTAATANAANEANLPESGPLNANSSNANVGIAVTTKDEEAALLQMEDDWNDAYAKRDEAWFQRNLADDYTETGDSGKMINDKAGAIASMLADGSTEMVAELSEMKARVEGNSAVVTGINRFRQKDEKGHTQEFRHRFTDTFIKRDGRWLIWANQATKIP